MKKTWCLALWCSLMGIASMRFASATPVTAAQTTFERANQSFEKGDIDQALELYSSLVRQGFESPELFYNLGNAHYRRGERGLAILWYERAHLLAPRDSDIQFNLSLARSHLKEQERPFWESVILYFGSNELAVVVLTVGLLFFGLLGAQMFGWIRNESLAKGALAMSGSILLFAVLWLGSNIALVERPLAVVVAPPGEVRNGPGNEYQVGFTIPEGSKVTILGERPDWIQVGALDQGMKGWIEAKDVQRIKGKAASLN